MHSESLNIACTMIITITRDIKVRCHMKILSVKRKKQNVEIFDPKKATMKFSIIVQLKQRADITNNANAVFLLSSTVC